MVLYSGLDRFITVGVKNLTNLYLHIQIGYNNKNIDLCASSDIYHNSLMKRENMINGRKRTFKVEAATKVILKLCKRI